MKNLHFSFLTLLLLFTLSWFPKVGFSFENIGFLKGGVTTGVAEINSLGKKDFFLGLGFNTHAGYRWTNWEFQLSSYIYVARMAEGMVFHASEETVVANGNLRNVSFTPMAKYLTGIEPKKNWKLYFSAGPMVSLLSIKLKSFRRKDGTQADNYKVSFQSYGGAFAIGIEEITKFKQMHPVYVELMYQIQTSDHSFLNNATDTKMVRTIKKDNGRSEKTMNQMILLSFGMTVF